MKDTGKNTNIGKRLATWMKQAMGSVRIGRIDWYIMKKFLSTYVFLIAIVILIAIIFDYNEKIDKFTQSHVPVRKIVFDYYLNFIPYFSNLFSPLFVFIAVILFTSNLASNSEIIAMKAAGMSFRRLLRPYMLSAFLIAVVTFFLGAYVIPVGNISRVNFENAYVKKKSTTTADNVQMQVDTGVVAYITHFDNVTKSGYGFSLDKFVDKKLVSHLTAQNIQYDTLSDRRYSWTIRMYNIRTLKGRREKISSGEKLDTMIMMEPSDFFYTKNQQETMTLPQLGEFIGKQKMRGAPNVNTFEVEYHKRFAMPFAAFILTVIGVSLSSQKRKGGMGISLGIGLALSFTYIMFQTVSATFSTNAGMPAALAAWIPNAVFAVIAFILYKRTPE
uniref:LptF/LptG family permease n=1 Tax=Alloprevotella sp. TaxID=1872471 RepID=UPI003FF0A5A8